MSVDMADCEGCRNSHWDPWTSAEASNAEPPTDEVAGCPDCRTGAEA